ncbi:MAG: hypothetical protein K2K89_08755 [Ruminococcus sp.]|nr:hypothetical protein [Ruminococcus sp.]
MAFIKELVSDSNEKLYLSFEMYDYDQQTISKLKPYATWVADHKQKIYFTFIGGGSLEHPQQFDLIWQNKKIVIFAEKSVSREPLIDNPVHMNCLYNIISIYAPTCFISQQTEMIDLIIEAFTVYHSTNFIKGIPYKNKNSMTISKIATPKYYDKVK